MRLFTEYQSQDESAPAFFAVFDADVQKVLRKKLSEGVQARRYLFEVFQTILVESFLGRNSPGISQGR